MSPMLSPSMHPPPQPAELPMQDVRDIITSSVSPGTTIASISLLPSRGVHRVYEAQLSDGLRVQVVIPPPPLSRLLRSEQMMTQTEATVVRWLREAVRQTDTGELLSSRKDDIDLLTLLPAPVLLSHPPPLAMSFSIRNPSLGIPIFSLPQPLTPQERVSVDCQAGRLVRRLSHFTPTSGKFGPALAVLTPRAEDGTTVGMAKWSVAFHSILEGILRDGEDVAVALAYPTIRRHFRRLGHLLDTVTIPCLVVVDFVDDTNLLVQREKPGQKEEKGRGSSPCADISITGIRDWSHCVFGDPLFAYVFCNQPSASFLSGFNGTRAETTLCQQEFWESVQDGDNRTARMLLYQCYHSIVQIVKGFYRPGQDQTVHELAARKQLTEILSRLDKINEEPILRTRIAKPSKG